MHDHGNKKDTKDFGSLSPGVSVYHPFCSRKKGK